MFRIKNTELARLQKLTTIAYGWGTPCKIHWKLRTQIVFRIKYNSFIT